MAKAKNTTPTAATDDLGLDAPATTKPVKAAKLSDKVKATSKPAKAPQPDAAKKVGNALAGKKLVPTEKAGNVREGTVRASVIGAFKGGRLFDAALDKLSASYTATPRGTEMTKAKLSARVASMVRKGFLEVA